MDYHATQPVSAPPFGLQQAFANERFVKEFVALESSLANRQEFASGVTILCALGIILVPALEPEHRPTLGFFGATYVLGISVLLAANLALRRLLRRQHLVALGISQPELEMLRAVWQSCVHGARSGDHIVERMVTKLSEQSPSDDRRPQC